ncbi:MAG: PAS domain S-box protein [Candidatus Hydrogenedentota bacterium]
MSSENDSYVALIRGVELVALAARYLILVIMVVLFALGQIQGNLYDLSIIIAVVLAHSLFAHWVLWKRRYDLFVSYFNLLLYLFEFSVVVSFSGADESPGFVLYVIFLIGFSAYRRDLRTILLAAVACCVAFTIVLLIELRLAGLSRTLGELIFKQLSILAAGWLVGNLSHRLLRVEQQAFTQAQRLASSEATLRTILDHAADAILVFDENELVVDANDGACQYFKASREELVGTRVRSFLFDDGTIPQKFAAIRRKGVFNGEQLIVGPDGEERTIEIVVRSFNRDDKQYYVALGHDITPQKEVQEANRQANLRLERLNRELRHVDALRTGFFAAISRNLRSPLSAVLGYLEMLLQEELGDLNKDQRKALQTCRRGTLRAFRIIDETLALRQEEEPEPAPPDTPSPETSQASPDRPDERSSLNGVEQD